MWDPHPNWPLLFANFVSNSYEEVIFRGVILGLLLTVLGDQRRCHTLADTIVDNRTRPRTCGTSMEQFPKDIYTEPEPEADTLRNLGPLTEMAGLWTGTGGLDVNPKPDGPERQPFVEHIELQPIDAQTNGPQLFYGLRYHTRIIKPGDDETLHDQVGYWLWGPATGTVIQTLSIPRGQVAMAVGRATADARTFRLQAIRGSTTNGIVSVPFLEHAFRTESYTITVQINVDGTWSYELDTVLTIPGQTGPFHHTDRNTLRRIGAPIPNPTAQAAALRSREAS